MCYVTLEAHAPQGRRHLKATSGAQAGPPPPSTHGDSAAQAVRCYLGPNGTYAPYCTQTISTELNEAVVGLLDKLTTWQQRTRVRDPHNAKAKRRYVSGLRCVWVLMKQW